MLFVKVGAALELAAESEDAIFGEGRADNLQADRQAVDESTWNSKSGKTS